MEYVYPPRMAWAKKISELERKIRDGKTIMGDLIKYTDTTTTIANIYVQRATDWQTAGNEE